MFFNYLFVCFLTYSSYFRIDLFYKNHSETFYYFIIFSTLCIFFAAVCVFSRNIIHVLFSLVSVFILSSGCLFCINVEFLAVVFVMVYVGAIIVLFLFAVMLLNFRIVAYHNIRDFVNVIIFMYTFICVRLFLATEYEEMFYL